MASITQDDVLTALEGQTPRQYAEKRRWLADFFSHAKAQKWARQTAPTHPISTLTFGRAFPRSSKTRSTTPALAHADLPAIMKKLGQSEACRALAFTILTAVRTGDTEGATWAQISKDDVWTIPVAKNGRGSPRTSHHGRTEAARRSLKNRRHRCSISNPMRCSIA